MVSENNIIDLGFLIVLVPLPAYGYMMVLARDDPAQFFDVFSPTLPT